MQQAGRAVRKRYRHYKYLIVLAPLLIVWAVLSVYPNISIIPLSFYKWNGLSQSKAFVGWQNFRVIFQNKTWFAKCFANTMFYTAVILGIQTLLSIALALALRKDTRFNKLSRSVVFLPIVLSSAAIGTAWTYIYDGNFGLLHNAFESLGLSGAAAFNYLSGRYNALFFIAIVQIWAGLGVPVTLLIAGLNSIGEEQYEAARIDGASPRQINWKITLPQLLPTILRVMLLTINGAVMSFDYVFLVGGTAVGGVAKSYDTWAVTIYKNLTSDNYGMVAANSTVLAALMFVILVVQYFATKKAEDRFL